VVGGSDPRGGKVGGGVPSTGAGVVIEPVIGDDEDCSNTNTVQTRYQLPYQCEQVFRDH
jgi:hypothetical protein